MTGKLLEMENKAELLNERLSNYKQILQSPINYYLIDQKEDNNLFVKENKKINILQDTCDFILDSSWQ